MGYKGHLCIHGLVAAVDLLSRTHEGEWVAICDAACNACHDNWQRSTYITAGAQDKVVLQPVAPTPVTHMRRHKTTSEDAAGMDARFRRARGALPDAVVTAVLKILEMRCMFRNNFTWAMAEPSLQVTQVEGCGWGEGGLGLRSG